MTEKVDIMESSSYYFISCIGDSVCKGTKLAWLRESEQKLETTLLVYLHFILMYGATTTSTNTLSFL